MAVALWLVPLLLVADQVLKLEVLSAVGPRAFNEYAVPIRKLFWIFDATFLKNTGAAFGLFQGGAQWLVWISLIVGFGLLIYMGRTRLPWLNQVALSLIAAGALGNAIDRLGRGWVVDYLDINRTGLSFLDNFPVFNLADSCVVVGVILLLLPQRRRRF